MIEIKEVKSKKQLKQFVDLPFTLYKGNAYWVPPIKKDELKQWNKDKNPAYEFSETKLWLVYKDEKPAGRIAAIINHAYNKKVGEKYGRFSRIEFIDDPEVSRLLLKTAESWLQEKGMKKIHGPLGFTNLDTQGLLIEGFDHLQCLASVYHLPYYRDHIEALGYHKENDWIEFRLHLSDELVKKGERGAALLTRRFGFEVVSFQSKDEMMQYADYVFDILNDAFEKLPYVVRFNDRMKELYKEKYFQMLDYRFVFFVKDKEKVVGFFVGIPSLSKALQKANGSLYPMGIVHILKAFKNIEVIDLTLTGVDPEYQTKGVPVLIFNQLHQALIKNGIRTMETTGIFEDNHGVINNWKNYDHIQHKRRRCFVKEL
jgi:GNAT superfamily N-acetyltransferase